MCHSFQQNINQHNIVSLQHWYLIIRNVYSVANQPIRMISEASCDTEDWSIDAENSALTSHE